MQGRDYFFTDKATFRSEAASGHLLEYAAITKAHPPTHSKGKKAALESSHTYLYGTSITTVREVAATGKLCVMGVDEQGIAALRANKRIDGLYFFIKPPSMADLEQRMRGRLKEAQSTIDKRLAWAADQATQVRARSRLVRMF